MLRVVIDTNLLVRGLLKGKTAVPLIEALKNNRFTLILSSPLVAELVEVLGRDKFKKYFSSSEIKELLDILDIQGEMINATEAINACRDPKDNIVLECAVSGRADFIITSDDDLLVLSPFRGIKIVTLMEFLQILI
jgi:putative PIN family toxin of toxin-antitoxin system